MAEYLVDKKVFELLKQSQDCIQLAIMRMHRWTREPLNGKEASVGDSPETPYSVSGTGEAAGRSDSSGNEVGTLRPNSNSEIEETVHERVPEVPVLFRGAPITWDRSPKEQ